MFPLKDKVQNLSCVIYKSICSCGEISVGGIIRNCKIRWNESNHVNKKCEPVRHLARNIEHEFGWYIPEFLKIHAKEEFWKLKTNCPISYWTIR